VSERRRAIVRGAIPAAACALVLVGGCDRGDFPRLVGEVKVVAAPDHPSDTVDARGQVAIVTGRGEVFWSRLPDRPRRIGALGGPSWGQAFWSSDGHRVLIFVDVCSSTNWCLWDGRRFTQLRGIERDSATDSQLGRALAWVGPDRILTGVHPHQDALQYLGGGCDMVALIGLDPLRRIRTVRPRQDERQGLGHAWLSPDLSYFVVVVTSADRLAREPAGSLIEVWGVDGRRRAWFRERVPDEVADVHPITWPNDSADEFVVRTGDRAGVRYDRGGQCLGPIDHEALKPSWTDGIQHVPDRRLVRDSAGRWCLDTAGRARPIAPKGVTAFLPVCTHNGEFVLYWGLDRTALYAYRAASHDVLCLPKAASEAPWRAVRGAWAPDGVRFAVVANRSGVGPCLLVVKAATGRGINLTTLHRRPPLKVRIGGWTADSSALVYEETPGDSEPREYWAAAADGSARRKLLGTNANAYLSWRPEPAR
jgi:hypothetical protein